MTLEIPHGLFCTPLSPTYCQLAQKLLTDPLKCVRYSQISANGDITAFYACNSGSYANIRKKIAFSIICYSLFLLPGEKFLVWYLWMNYFRNQTCSCLYFALLINSHTCDLQELSVNFYKIRIFCVTFNGVDKFLQIFCRSLQL